MNIFYIKYKPMCLSNETVTGMLQDAIYLNISTRSALK